MLDAPGPRPPGRGSLPPPFGAPDRASRPSPPPTTRIRVGTMVLCNGLHHPFRARQGGRHARLAVRRPRGARPRRRLPAPRLRGGGTALRPGPATASAAWRSPLQVLRGLFGDRPLTYRGRHPPGHRAGQLPQAGPAATSAVPCRGRAAAHAGDRGQGGRHREPADRVHHGRRHERRPGGPRARTSWLARWPAFARAASDQLPRAWS